MNFLLDATLGMLVIWAAVKLVSKLVEHKQWSLLVFGEYGECTSSFHHAEALQTHWSWGPAALLEEIPSSFLTRSVGTFLIAFPVCFYSKPKPFEIF